MISFTYKPEFVNVQGTQESILSAYVALAGRYKAIEINSLNRFLGSLNGKNNPRLLCVGEYQ
jgi:hypothetical protein